MASTPHQDTMPPSATATITKATAEIPARTPVQMTRPPKTSPGASGVLTMAWKLPNHLSPPITGQSESAAAACMTLAMSRPGVTKTR